MNGRRLEGRWGVEWMREGEKGGGRREYNGCLGRNVRTIQKKNLELKAFINEDSIANLQFHLS